MKLYRLFTTLASWLLLAASAWAQPFTITGKVTDAQTGQPLTGASVFCQNTTIGTTTTADGNFRLSLPEGGYDLVVSYNGYETFSSRIGRGTEAGDILEARLKVKDRSLEEISIVATTEVRDGWNKYGTFFRGQFLGMTEGVESCVIENADSLRFFYSRKRDRLKVTAREPLRIRNEALGYRIRYELDSFTHEYGPGNTEYVGYALFEEMEGTDEQQKDWKEKRQDAYFGSILHFMRCYYDSTFGINGYELSRLDPATGNSKRIYDPYDSTLFIALEDGDAMLLSIGRLYVTYTQEKPEVQYLNFKKERLNSPFQKSSLDFPESIVIERNGYCYDQKQIKALGYWAWEKLARLLPYDYDPD